MWTLDAASADSPAGRGTHRGLVATRSNVDQHDTSNNASPRRRSPPRDGMNVRRTRVTSPALHAIINAHAFAIDDGTRIISSGQRFAWSADLKQTTPSHTEGNCY
jgi:hypothetical protein